MNSMNSDFSDTAQEAKEIVVPRQSELSKIDNTNFTHDADFTHDAEAMDEFGFELACERVAVESPAQLHKKHRSSPHTERRAKRIKDMKTPLHMTVKDAEPTSTQHMSRALDDQLHDADVTSKYFKETKTAVERELRSFFSARFDRESQEHLKAHGMLLSKKMPSSVPCKATETLSNVRFITMESDDAYHLRHSQAMLPILTTTFVSAASGVSGGSNDDSSGDESNEGGDGDGDSDRNDGGCGGCGGGGGGGSSSAA
eukprot:g2951.t1